MFFFYFLIHFDLHFGCLCTSMIVIQEIYRKVKKMDINCVFHNLPDLVKNKEEFHGSMVASLWKSSLFAKCYAKECLKKGTICEETFKDVSRVCNYSNHDRVYIVLCEHRPVAIYNLNTGEKIFPYISMDHGGETDQRIQDICRDNF